MWKLKVKLGKTSYGTVLENLGWYVLTGNDTVPISVWYGRGMHSSDYGHPM